MPGPSTRFSLVISKTERIGGNVCWTRNVRLFLLYNIFLKTPFAAMSMQLIAIKLNTHKTTQVCACTFSESLCDVSPRDYTIILLYYFVMGLIRFLLVLVVVQ